MDKPAGTRESQVLLLNPLANDSASNILEHRPGFLDIRAKRKAYLAKKGSEKSNVVE
jgi:hypothetical protein